MNSLQRLRLFVFAILSWALLCMSGCPQGQNVILLEVQSPEDLARLEIIVIPLDGSADAATTMRDVNRTAAQIAATPVHIAIQLQNPRDVMVILRAQLVDGRRLFAQRCMSVVGTVQDSVWMVLRTDMNDQDGDGFPGVPNAGCFRPGEGGATTPRSCPADDPFLCSAIGQFDCADNNRDRYPFATEVCGNSVDEDCDGVVADCTDEDGDGFLPCAMPMDTSGTCDCAEGNPAVHPGAADPCGDGIDTDCDGQDDLCDEDCDGYPVGIGARTFEDCPVPAAAVGRVTEASVHPNGALASILRRADGDRIARGCMAIVTTMTSSDACSASHMGDGVDQDCNGFIDDGVNCDDIFDRDRDGSRVCAMGVTMGCDRNDCDPGIRFGGREICGNGLDEDGDGMIAMCAPNDTDHDGHVSLSAGGDDCDDTDPHVYLGAPENCTTLTVSESCTVNTPCGTADSDRDGYRDEPGVDCDPMNPMVHPWADEVECNGIDDDCDMLVDELLLEPGDPMPRGCVSRAGNPEPVNFTDPMDYPDSSYCGGCGITTDLNEDCCGSVVTDVSLPTRCGDCDTNCGSHSACERARDMSGAVIPPMPSFGNQYVCGCEANWDDCDMTFSNGCEIDLLTDEANCGRCGVMCGQNQTCVGGSCTCDPNFGDCDLGTNGCETDLLITFNNCSACGVACAAGAQFCDRSCMNFTMCTGAQYESRAPNPRQDRICSPLTVCTGSQYESVPATATSDRVCAPLRVCTASEYQTVAPTATTNRVCAPLTVCNASEYQTVAPTATSNRVCAPLTVCTASEYQSTAPTATSNRVCSALRVCTASEYQSTAPTATTNRVCTATTICTASQYETVAPTATSNRVCAAITTCTASQYETTPPTATSNRVCAGLTVCTGTQYETVAPTATSNRVCAALTVCTASQYQSTAPTATSDRACSDLTVCTASEYQTVAPTATSNRVCAALTVCTASQYQSTAPTATSNRVCSPLTVCTASQYESTAPTATSNRVCTALRVCTASQYETVAPTATSNRVCAALTVCTASEYQTTAPTATTDRECTPLTVCTGSEYQSTAPTATSDRVCSTLTVCMAGQFVMTAPTATTNRICANCAAGRFSTTMNAASCALWATCTMFSQYEMTPGSPTSNRVCGTCAMNTADCNTNGGDACEADLTSSATCRSCGNSCPGGMFCMGSMCMP